MLQNADRFLMKVVRLLYSRKIWRGISIGNHMNLSAIWEIIAPNHALEGMTCNFTRRSRVKLFLLMHGECNYFPKLNENSCNYLLIIY